MSRLSLHLFQFCVSALWAEQLRRRCPSSRCLPGWGTRWGSPAAGGPTRWCSGAATCTTSPRATRGASWSATPPKQMRVRTHLDISPSVCLHKILCLQNPQSNPWSNRKWANSHVSPWPLHSAGIYLCYHNASVVGEVELLVSAAVPLWEADAEEADSDYLRWLDSITRTIFWGACTRVCLCPGSWASPRPSPCSPSWPSCRASRCCWSGTGPADSGSRDSSWRWAEAWDGWGGLDVDRHFTNNFTLSSVQDSPGEDESLELVPNITLNPSFNIDMLEHIEPEFHESRWGFESRCSRYFFMMLSYLFFSEQAFLVGSTVHII